MFSQNEESAMHRSVTVLSQREKKNYFFQEIFGGFNSIKKYLTAIMVFVFLTEIAKNLYISLTQKHLTTFREVCLINIPLCLAFCAYFFLFLEISEKRLSFYKKFRMCMLWIGSITLSLSVGSQAYFSIGKLKFDPESKATVYSIMKCFVSGLYMSMMVDLITPIWFLKALVPIAYLTGLIVGCVQLKFQDDIYSWIILSTGILNILLICWMKAYFRWRLFINKINNDNWNRIHDQVLNRVPNPIVVLNGEEPTYMNPEFKRLAEDDFKGFLQKIVNIKRRRNIRHHFEEQSSLQDRSRQERSISLDEPRMSFNTGVMKRAKTIGLHNMNEDIDTLEQLLEKVREMFSEGTFGDEVYMVFDGKFVSESRFINKRSFEITLSFIAEGQSIIMILKDTTEHTRLVSLETSSEYKDQLLASISHELKTPLNSHLALIESAISHNSISPAVTEEYLIPAYRSGRLLLFSISDILDYSQIAAKKFILNLEATSIRKTIRSCFQLFEIQIRKKGLIFNCIIDENVPDSFKTDHQRVKQILVNLLMNAQKFTFNGEINIRAEMVDSVNLKVSVEDTGIGILYDKVKKLFREFTTIEPLEKGTMNAQGVGLGLVISDKLAKRLGPRLSNKGVKVKSSIGEGSTFSFTVLDQSKIKRPSLCGDDDECFSYTWDAEPPKGQRLQLTQNNSSLSLDKD